MTNLGSHIFDPNELSTQFLAPDEVPQQGKKPFRIGDDVCIVRPRHVVRVGYRLLPKDFVSEAKEQFQTPEGWRLLKEMEKLLVVNLAGHPMNEKLIDALAYAKARAAKFGGPERGVVVRDMPWGEGKTVRVLGTKRAQIGVRYPSSGSMSLWADDYEQGGLAHRRTITLCETHHGLMLASDLEHVSKDGVP